MHNKKTGLLSLLLTAVLLCGCAPQTAEPAEAPEEAAELIEQTEQTEQTVQAEPSNWIENRTMSAPVYPSDAASERNRALSQELYEQLLKEPPIDFFYGGKRFSENREAWRETAADGEYGKTVTYTHTETGLALTIGYRLYDDTSALEWTLRMSAADDKKTDVVSDFLTLSMGFPTKGNTSLFYSNGGNAVEDDFLPVNVPLKNGDETWIACNGGRSSSGVLPFFNLYTANDKGYIGAIGWSGQWKTEVFKQDDVVCITSRMTDSNFYLEPGESVMLPSMLLLPWEGDAQDAHNDLRHQMVSHHTPKYENGEIPVGPVSCGVWGTYGAENDVALIGAITNRGMNYDALWIDAGWYGDGSQISQNTFDSAWFETVGSWNVLEEYYPNGMIEVARSANENGLGLLLWFEPERAFEGTELVVQHPEWFLSTPDNPQNYIINLGDEQARLWLTDYIAGLILEYGVNIYRQDFNVEPLSFWRKHDAEDRQGVTEMKYIEGLYLYWEGLLERCPGLIIDNCASGGRRLDFEAAGRSISLFHSDYQCNTTTSTAEGCQCEVYGLNYWFPVSGSSAMGKTDAYTFRSNFGMGVQTPNVLGSAEEQTALTNEYKSVRSYCLEDYYPLTDFPEQQDTGWFAFQMHRSSDDTGVIYAFRRIKSEDESITVRLGGLDAEKDYRVSITDTDESFVRSGAELMQGFRIGIDRKKDSRLIRYEEALQ